MKKLFQILCFSATLFAATQTAKAQYVTRTSIDTTANADTSLRSFSYTPDGVVGVEAYAVKISGSGTGYAVLEGRIDSLTGWAPISTDTLKVLTATSGTYKKLWPVAPHFFNGLRIRYVTTGTQSSSIRAAYLRRTTR